MKFFLPLLALLAVSTALAQNPRRTGPSGIPLPGQPGTGEEPNPLPDNVSLDSRKRTDPEIIPRNKDGYVDPNALAVPAGEAIELPKADGIAVAAMIYEHSGKRVILTKATADTEVFFVQRGPLTNGEVMDLLSASLLLEGLAIIPDQQNPNIVRLLPSGPTQGLAGQALPYIDNEIDLPASDQLVTYRMTFNYLKPEDALTIFQSVVGQFGPSGKISAVPQASSLIVTENSALIRQLIQLKEDIDVAATVGDKWVHLTYADVEEVATQLNEIYGQQSQQGGRGGAAATRRTTGSPAPPIPGLQNNANGGGAQPGGDVPIRIIPDTRTNRILLIGRPTDLAQVERLIAQYDIPADPKSDFRYKLKFIRVGLFIPVAEQAIQRTLSGDAQSTGGGRATTNRQGNSRNQNNRNNRRTGQQTGGGFGGGAGGAGGRGGGGGIQAEEVPEAPEATIVGKTLLVANNVENSIMVQGPPHHIEIVKNLIDDLDKAAQQVVISAVVGSYSIGNGLNFGVDLAGVVSGGAGGARSSFNLAGGPAVPGVVGPAALADLASVLTASGFNGQGVSLYGFFGGDDFGVFINALESTNNFRVLERSTIVTRNNNPATLTSGQRIAVPSSTFTNGTGNNSVGQTTNIDFRDVVLELEIQPLINSDDEVTLNISLVRDTLGQNRSVGELVVPDINSQTLTSTVRVPNGAAIVLGGLITESERNDKSGIPVLSRIPGLGNLFSVKDKSVNKQELVILLRPEIINGKEGMFQYQQNYEAHVPIARDSRLSLPRNVVPMGSPATKGGVNRVNLSATEKKRRASAFTAPKRKKSRRGGRARR